MRNGVQARGSRRVAGNEDQLAGPGPVLRPLEVVFSPDRLAVFINVKQCQVEIVTSISKVVRIASEEGNLELRRENQTHVRVFLVAIQIVLATLVPRTQVAAQ